MQKQMQRVSTFVLLLLLPLTAVSSEYFLLKCDLDGKKLLSRTGEPSNQSDHAFKSELVLSVQKTSVDGVSQIKSVNEPAEIKPFGFRFFDAGLPESQTYVSVLGGKYICVSINMSTEVLFHVREFCTENQRNSFWNSAEDVGHTSITDLIFDRTTQTLKGLSLGYALGSDRSSKLYTGAAFSGRCTLMK